MNYGKTFAMLAATVLSGIVAAMTGDEKIAAAEWVNIALTVVAAANVLAAPNVPGARYTKVVLAVLTAVGGTLLSSTLVTPGISLTEWLQLLIAALGAAGVYAARYEAPPALKVYQPRPSSAE